MQRTEEVILKNLIYDEEYTRKVLPFLKSDYFAEKEDQNFDSDFKPELTPKEMLDMGVFGGKYITDCKEGIPESGLRM